MNQPREADEADDAYTVAVISFLSLEPQQGCHGRLQSAQQEHDTDGHLS